MTAIKLNFMHHNNFIIPNYEETNMSQNTLWECPSCNQENMDSICDNNTELIDAWINFKRNDVTPIALLKHDQCLVCHSCSSSHLWSTVVHLSDSADSYFNLIDALSRSAYGVPACDLTNDEAALHSLQDSFSSNVLPLVALERVRQLQAKEILRKLGDIKRSNDGFTEEAFLHFKSMVSVSSIQQWIESEFNK